jgi:hypothetical protein
MAALAFKNFSNTQGFIFKLKYISFQKAVPICYPHFMEKKNFHRVIDVAPK